MRSKLIFSFAIIPFIMIAGGNFQGKTVRSSHLTRATTPDKRLCNPVADAGPHQELPPIELETTLDGTGSWADCNRTIVAYKWTKENGPTAFIITSSQSVTSVVLSTNGDYAFKLQVWDNMGGTSTDVVLVTNR